MNYTLTRRMNSSFRYLAVFVLLVFSIPAKAQLNITPGVSAATLVANLVGTGMTVTNISLNCAPNAYGTFSNGNTTNINITNGIMLTTGSAVNALGPNNSTSTGTCNGTTLNDPQLTSISPLATRDPCILEFDIIPQCNTLTINFVFGSEEYPEFVFSTYNDAFGFWITGPGPACQPGFYNNTNVATLPNNSTVVSINNVNPSVNSAYYVNNLNGPTIQYDGFTTVLTRNVALCPCQTYHWKIAIADAGDCIYDSGVFLDFLSCSTALTATSTVTPAICNACNGVATVTPTGSAPFTYSWAPSGGNAATATGLCAGTYTCTIDDALTCSPPITMVVVVPAATAPLATISTQTDVTCNGACDGSTNVIITSGTGPYTYSWSPSGGNSSVASGLCPGTYTCTMSDAGGCTGTSSFTITQPPVLTAASSGTSISCFGGANGTATATAAGGSPGYLFTWQPSGGNAATATGLSAGTYTCIITDANGCSVTTSVTLTEPPAVTTMLSGTNISCFAGTNGSAVVFPGGGTGSYTFAWAPSGGNAASANTLSAGTYTVTVSDANGCTAIDSITLTEPPVLSVTTSGVAATCSNACDGELLAAANGGTTPYNYAWSSGCLTPGCTNVCAGTYTITVTDANSCTITDSITITQPTPVTQTVSSTPENCIAVDGTASTVAGGGTGPYTYSWQPGNGNAALYSNISSGQYTVTVTDANNCTSVDSVTVGNVSGLVVAAGPVTNVSCNAACDGSLSVNATSGAAPFVYAWSPSGGNAATASGLCPNTYTCAITDAFGCTTSLSFTITEPTVLTVSTATPSPVICIGATVNLSATAAGGTAGYTYAWMPGNLTGATPAVSPIVTTTYTVTATDANGCTATATELVLVNPNLAAAFSGMNLSGCAPLTVDFTDLSTIGAPSTITSWTWELGDNTTSTLQNPTHTYVVPGSYPVTLTVTSSNGCTASIILNNYVNVFPNPVAGFSSSPQPTTIMESTIMFTDQSTGATAWQWSFGDVANSSSTLQNPSFTYPDTVCYSVQQIVTSADLCRDTAEAIICIRPDWALYIPNAFTPNGDGINDVFIPVGTGIEAQDYELWIFDRWGNLIFFTDDLHKGWNGSVDNIGVLCQLDTYVYKVKYVDSLGGAHKYIGKVSVVR